MSRSLLRGLLIATLLLAFALRVYHLGAQELRGDEAFGFFFQQRSYAAIMGDTITLQEPHPVASYFVQKAWVTVAGESEFALRLSGVLFSVLAVALLARLGRRLGLPDRNSLLGAALLALSPYAIWHSQDARMYSMSLALNTATIWLAVEALARRRWQWIAAYLLTAWLALHTHYFSVFVLLGLTLFVAGRALAAPAARMAVRDWILWNVLLALAYAPWLTVAGETLAGYGGNGDSPGFAVMLQRSLSIFAVGESIPTEQRLVWAVLAGMAAATGVLTLGAGGANQRRALWLLACCVGVPVLLTWYGAWDRPIFNERYLIAAAPPFYLLLAAGIPTVPARGGWPNWAGLLLWLFLLAGMVLGLNRYYHDPAWSKTRGWRELAATMLRYGSGLPPGQVYYAQNYPDPTLWYYTGEVQHGVLPPQANDREGAAAEVARVAQSGVTRVLLAEQPSPAWDPNGFAHSTLEGRYWRVAQPGIGGFSLAAYTQLPASFTPLDVQFERTIRLSGFSLEPNRLIPGGLLTVHLAWQQDIAAIAPYQQSVSAQLLDPAGDVVAQSDHGYTIALPPRLDAYDPYGILLPETLAPGTYRLIVVVYDPSQAGLPRLLVNNGSDHAEIARWTVR